MGKITGNQRLNEKWKSLNVPGKDEYEDEMGGKLLEEKLTDSH